MEGSQAQKCGQDCRDMGNVTILNSVVRVDLTGKVVFKQKLE